MMIMMMMRRRRGDHEAAGDGDDDIDEHDKHDGADLHACCHEKMVSMLLSRQYFSLCWRVVVRLPCIVAYAIWLRRRRTSFLGLFSFLLFRSTACVLHGFFEDLFSVFVVRSFFCFFLRFDFALSGSSTRGFAVFKRVLCWKGRFHSDHVSSRKASMCQPR